MAWKGLHITKTGKLCSRNNSLSYLPDTGEEIRVPLEDLAFVVVDSREVVVTTSLLSSLSASNVALLVCNEKHLPSGLLVPIGNHYRHSRIAHLQKAMSKRFEHNIWGSIVKTKIKNQSKALDFLSKDGTTLGKIAELVRPGDQQNVEARAAKEYWKMLFCDFVRANKEDVRNAALNYGYAIVRSVIARSCVAHGLVLAFGVHHSNIYNPFNLADDLMECFRPVVDIEVAALDLDEGASRLEKDTRQTLVGLPLKSVLMQGDLLGVMPAADLLVQSFVRALESKNPKELILPEIIA